MILRWCSTSTNSNGVKASHSSFSHSVVTPLYIITSCFDSCKLSHFDPSGQNGHVFFLVVLMFNKGFLFWDFFFVVVVVGVFHITLCFLKSYLSWWWWWNNEASFITHLKMKAARPSDGLSCWLPSPENRDWKLEFDQFQWSDLCEWSCIISRIVLRLEDLIFYTDSLYRLLSRLSYNWRQALLYVPILVLLLSPLSPYLFLLLYAFNFEVIIVFILICSICILK